VLRDDRFGLLTSGSDNFTGGEFVAAGIFASCLSVRLEKGEDKNSSEKADLVEPLVLIHVTSRQLASSQTTSATSRAFAQACAFTSLSPSASKSSLDSSRRLSVRERKSLKML
jgi:hypothetical protein